MKWCTLGFDKKGVFVYWSWCSSFWSEDFDSGEYYHLDMPFDWWAKSWKEAKEVFDDTYHTIIVPFFIAYLFLGVQTIIESIKRKRMSKTATEAEFKFFRTHYWDDDLNDWVEQGAKL